MLKFGPFSGHFDYLARIQVLARNFGSSGSSEYEKLARDLAVPRSKPKKPEPESQVYPFYPLHTVNNKYQADSAKDKSEDDQCNKDYNESSTFTGGITHITCNHSIVKGFTAMKRGESVKMIINPCITRLPQRVQANRRFLLHDNAC